MTIQPKNGIKDEQLLVDIFVHRSISNIHLFLKCKSGNTSSEQKYVQIETFKKKSEALCRASVHDVSIKSKSVDSPPGQTQGPVSRKSRELFGPEKLVVKLQSACFEKMIFLHVFNIRKIKRIAKFEGLEPRRCADIKGIVATERDPKTFGTFEKQAPGHLIQV